MNWILKKLFRLHKEESGAALLYITIAIPVIIAITSLAVDLGYVWYVKTRLQVAADMGALAGASKLYTDSEPSVVDLANTYVNYNLPSGWTSGVKPTATVTPKVKCVPAISAMGLTCSSLSGGNALKVTVNATVPLFFATALGFKTFNLQAESLVSGGGSSPPPLNVAIVLDATASMGPIGGTISCGSMTGTRIECATLAAKTLLTKLWASVDQVALYTYPAFTAASPGKIACTPGASGSTAAVNYQTSGNPNYQLFGFNGTYADTNNPPTTGLNLSSPLVLALGRNPTAGASNSTSCNGLNSAAIGKGTSIGDAILQAQRDLLAANVALLAAGQPKRQNVMIILSDGDANGNSGSCTGSDGADNDFLTGMDDYGNDCTNSWVNDVDLMAGQCQAAVTAAQAAAAPGDLGGTWVYAIAFGSEYQSGKSCFTDRPVDSVNRSAAASETFTRACTSGFPCQSKSSSANTVSSIIASPVTTGSGSSRTVTQDAFTAWGGTIATTCKKTNGSNAPNGTTSGATCTTTLTNGTKVQTDRYTLTKNNAGKYDTTACDAMRGMASDPSKFYSTDGNTKCSSAANPNFTDLVAIFNNVAASIMKKRRIPTSLANGI